jgi:hypothetical protein
MRLQLLVSLVEPLLAAMREPSRTHALQWTDEHLSSRCVAAALGERSALAE